jgi:acyl-CoA thioesterase II
MQESATTGSFAELLDLDRVSLDCFRAFPPESPGSQRVYGGFLMASALRAAALTLPPGRNPQSLHAYYGRAAELGAEVRFTVERVRDGRSFSIRRTLVSQSGKMVLSMQASFYVPGTGTVDWAVPAPTGVPEVNDLAPTPAGLPEALRFEVRRLPVAQTERPTIHPMWVRARGPLPDDWTIHACAIVSMSDYAAGAACAPPDGGVPHGASVSLDHTVHFHRPGRADEWLLLDAGPVSASGGRGFMRGGLWGGGTLLASVAQENYWVPGGESIWSPS